MVVATMRSPEAEPYKDKIEISLDGKQVFYLFFGGAVIACLVFVLGVMVGRRVEARAHVDRAAATSAARDPLAALDELDASSRDDLSFRTSLAGGKTTTEVDGAVAAIEKTRAAKAEPSKKADKPAKVDDDEDVAPPVVEEPAKKPEKKKVVAPEKKEAPAPEPVKTPEAGGGFTLQLNSFKDRAEAETFLGELRGSGYKAFLVEAEVDGKGTFYRVRTGHYDSYEAAIDAKATFESKVQKIAYVTRL
jgi:cell division septation protein DedD